MNSKHEGQASCSSSVTRQKPSVAGTNCAGSSCLETANQSASTSDDTIADARSDVRIDVEKVHQISREVNKVLPKSGKQK